MENPLAHFPPSREENLKRIWRYSMFEKMMYRTNVFFHANRVFWIVDRLSPLAKKYFKKFDPLKARIIALIHDDAEIIMGDFQAGHKDKMSKAQLAEIDRKEEAAIKQLARKYPEYVKNYKYKDLLEEALYKKTIEGQIVKAADRFDAYCECVHETLAGNLSFIQGVMINLKLISKLNASYPKIAPFLEDLKSKFGDLDSQTVPPFVREKQYLNKPFTKKSIEVQTDFPFYNLWREITIRRGGKEGMNELIKQKEYLRK